MPGWRIWLAATASRWKRRTMSAWAPCEALAPSPPPCCRAPDARHGTRRPCRRGPAGRGSGSAGQDGAGRERWLVVLGGGPAGWGGHRAPGDGEEHCADLELTALPPRARPGLAVQQRGPAATGCTNSSPPLPSENFGGGVRRRRRTAPAHTARAAEDRTAPGHHQHGARGAPVRRRSSHPSPIKGAGPTSAGAVSRSTSTRPWSIGHRTLQACSATVRACVRAGASAAWRAVRTPRSRPTVSGR
jgi:hypothetical protein